MGKYFWVIFVLLGLWQLIGSVAERATKKQQNQRVSDLAGQRRRQQMAPRRPTAGSTTLGATGPVVADRGGELAARRKAQLDELRRRRGAVTAQPTAQLPSRTRPTPATLRPARPPIQRPAVAPVAAPQRPRAPVRRQPTARPQARRAPPPQKRSIPPLERTIDTTHRSLTSRKSVAETKGPRMLALPGLGEVPMDRTLLRRMILYREILEPPIALREVQSWER